MRRICLSARLAVALLVTLLGPLSAAAQSTSVAVPRQVLAFYYGWYGTPQVSGQWRHWEQVRPDRHEIASTMHYPADGPYDSHDPAVIERQAAAAERAGLTGFIYSWWGRGQFEDAGVPLLLDAAQRHHLKVTIYIETVRGGSPADRQADAVADLRYILAQYAHHPAWLSVAGRPVIFIYNKAFQLAGNWNWSAIRREAEAGAPARPLLFIDWRNPAILAEFDGIHRYDVTRDLGGVPIAGLAAAARASDAEQVLFAGDRISCVTILPGHDVSKVRRQPDPHATDRDDGTPYRVLWQQAIAADPDWVLIVSWNEWHEGSEIEPSFENGARELTATAVFARNFLALPPKRHVLAAAPAP